MEHISLPSGTPASIAHVDSATRGLVVIPDIWGLRPLFDDLVDSLAVRTGNSVVSFELFPDLDLPGMEDGGFDARSAVLRKHADEQVLRDAVEAADATEFEVVDLIGFCVGGMYALKTSGTGRFHRVAAFYGMIRVPEVWEGPGQYQPLDALARRGTTEVMEITGGLDPWTPAEDIEALKAAGVEVVHYPDADHGFVHDPSRPTHRADDAADAWQKVLAFLQA